MLQFNIELLDTDATKQDLITWRQCDVVDRRPPPLIVETYLDAGELKRKQSLVIIDDNGKRWDVVEALLPPHGHQGSDNKVILEQWRIELGDQTEPLPIDLGSQLPTIYKKSGILFRSLFTYAKLLPAWKLFRLIKSHSSPTLKIRYRTYQGVRGHNELNDNLTVPLHPGAGQVTSNYKFGTVDSPAGPFSVEVSYRNNCEFRVDDHETLLSSRFMGADDSLFSPTLPLDPTQIGSLPMRRPGGETPPDLGQAYGSLSTFHQVGPAVGSPLSTLRAAGQFAPGSTPASPGSPTGKIAAPPPRHVQAMRMQTQRRPSLSFQPFKAPTLSASPLLESSSSRKSSPAGTKPVSAETPPDAPPRQQQPTASHSLARKPSDSSAAIPSASIASPKQPPTPKYSSSFSHRRNRPSSGHTSKASDDASGKSASSPGAPQPSATTPSSRPTSLGSLFADDDKISEFLSVLDSGKDLLSHDVDSSVNPQRTTTALGRFHRMKDSNAQLGDSISSSLMVQRPSPTTTRPISGVQQMFAGASGSPSPPVKQMSPHTAHAPAVPSRLSANSIVEYRDETNHPASGDASAKTDAGNDAANSNAAAKNTKVTAIDIPTSPNRYTSPYRRSVSGVATALDNMTRDGLDVDDEAGPLSLSELLHENMRVNDPEPAAPAAVNDSAKAGLPSVSPTSYIGRSYQPRFAHSRGPSFSSAIGRGNPARPSALRLQTDGANSGAAGDNESPPFASSIGSHRRGLIGHRFSFTRPPHYRSPTSGSGMHQGSVGNSNYFDDDEPFIFAMSEYNQSRRSLEEATPSTGTTGSTPIEGVPDPLSFGRARRAGLDDPYDL